MDIWVLWIAVALVVIIGLFWLMGKGDARVAHQDTEGQTARSDADDLKKIIGIGDTLQDTLREHGITRFSQIAALDEAQIAKLEDDLNFPGRIERDQWIEQARLLAEGRHEEHAERFGG